MQGAGAGFAEKLKEQNRTCHLRTHLILVFQFAGYNFQPELREPRGAAGRDPGHRPTPGGSVRVHRPGGSPPASHATAQSPRLLPSENRAEWRFPSKQQRQRRAAALRETRVREEPLLPPTPRPAGSFSFGGASAIPTGSRTRGCADRPTSCEGAGSLLEGALTERAHTPAPWSQRPAGPPPPTHRARAGPDSATESDPSRSR